MKSPGAAPTAEPVLVERGFPAVLRRYWVALVALTLVAVAVDVGGRFGLHLAEAYDVVAFPMNDRFIDLYCFAGRFEGFHHAAFFTAPESGYGFVTFMYPAPAALIYKLLFLFPKPVLWYGGSTVAGLVLCGLGYARALARLGVRRQTALLFTGTCLLCSYPLMVVYFLANIEIVLGFVIGLGLVCFLTERRWLAAALFGLAGAIKLYPFLFLALLLRRKQYAQIAFAAGLAAVVTVISLWAVSGSVAVSQHGITQGLEHYRQVYALPFASADVGIDHSLFGLIKGGIALLGLPYPAVTTMAGVLRWYLVATAVVGLGLWFLRIQFLPVMNQVLCLCTIAILFTPVSHDFTLMHLYVPLGMLALLAVDAGGRRVPGLSAALVCMLLLLVPLNEFVVHGNAIGGQMKAVALTVLLVVGMRFRLEAGQWREAARGQSEKESGISG